MYILRCSGFKMFFLDTSFSYKTAENTCQSKLNTDAQIVTDIYIFMFWDKISLCAFFDGLLNLYYPTAMKDLATKSKHM